MLDDQVAGESGLAVRGHVRLACGLDLQYGCIAIETRNPGLIHLNVAIERIDFALEIHHIVLQNNRIAVLIVQLLLVNDHVGIDGIARRGLLAELGLHIARDSVQIQPFDGINLQRIVGLAVQI